MIGTNARWRTLAALVVVAGLAGCGGGRSTASIGGTLSGLNSGATVVLQNNLSDTLTLNANGSFSFPTQISDNGTYSVTILTQPTGQNCSVGNGSGTVDSAGDNVANVTVVCTSSISVTVNGLTAGTSVGLSDGLGTTNVLYVPYPGGIYSFSDPISAGQTYNVSVVVQPVGLNCTVANGSGTSTGEPVTGIVVTCS